MKKTLVVSILAMSYLFAGCGTENTFKHIEEIKMTTETSQTAEEEQAVSTLGEAADSGYNKVTIGETSFTYPTDSVVVIEATDMDTGTVDGDDIYLFDAKSSLEGVPLASIRIFADANEYTIVGDDIKAGNWVFRDLGLYKFLYNYSAVGELLSRESDTYTFTMFDSDLQGNSYEFRLNCSEDGSFNEDTYNAVVEAMYNLAGEQFDVISYNDIVEEYNE